jgi:hypothetical protein
MHRCEQGYIILFSIDNVLASLGVATHRKISMLNRREKVSASSLPIVMIDADFKMPPSEASTLLNADQIKNNF